MARIDFLFPESKRVWQHIETAATRSHHDPQRAFADFLTMTLCALSGGLMESEYLRIAERYAGGEKGRQAIDAFPKAAGDLIVAMQRIRKDILGDIFQGAISHGDNGQYLTPESVCEAMARLTATTVARTSTEGVVGRFVDPCCGSGRMLLAAAEVNPRAELFGQDIDLRCVHMTAINLALWNLHGWVIHGDSLSDEERLVYRTGFNGRGFVAEVPRKSCPEPVRQIVEDVRAAGTQLALF